MKKWYDYIPHPVVILFLIMITMTILSYLLPAGTYERELVDGRQRVIPNSYEVIKSTPVTLLDMFKAVPMGFQTASNIIFVVLAGGIMFGILEKTRMIENSIGTLIKRLGIERKYLIVVLMTFIFGMAGVFIGYEHNIALVPIAAVLSLSIGGDLMLAAGISVGAITVGFGLSPFNPYTVGTGHQIAELPMYSGAGLRSLLCLSGLSTLAFYNVRYFKKIEKDASKSLSKDVSIEGISLSRPLNEYSMTRSNQMVLGIFLLGLAVMLYGIFVYKWYINEISAIFLMVAIVVGLATRMGGKVFSETLLKSVANVAPGAFMVGYATSIRSIMEMGNISDTVSYSLASLLYGLPTYISAALMTVVQSVLNILIPSGSGQALATLPIMIPLGEVLGLTRQTTILAFQIGDGVTNLFNPTLGGMIAMLAMCRIPLDKWLRFIFPLAFLILVISIIFLEISVFIGYGPA
jgi:uncharacterized ion transporter superfamily protein YfcC